MNLKWAKKGVVAATTCVLLVQGGIAAYPVPIANAASSSITNQIVYLNANSTIQLQDAQFLTQDSGRVLAYTFLITNKGSSEISLNDYWVRVTSSGGKSFSTKISEQDKSVSTVAPNSSKLITYYSYVDQASSMSDMKFNIVKWDFSAANYERVLGSIQYGKGLSEQTPYNKSVAMLYNDTKVQTSVKQYTLTQDSNNAYLQINLEMQNQGLNAIDLSSMNLFIQTANSEVYPVEASELSSTILQPKETETITMHVTLPKQIVGKSLSLVPSVKEQSSDIKLPIASFVLPTLQDSTLTAANVAKTTYIAGEKVNTFVDSSFVDRNIDSSVVTIQYALRNTGKKAVNYPDFSFSLVTDDGISYPLTYTKTDESQSKLLPNMREVLTITGKTVSDVDLSKAKLIVCSGVTDKSNGYVVGAYQFRKEQASGSAATTYKYGNYEVNLNAIQRTASADTDYLIADVEIKNTSTSTTSVPNLTGYFMINGVKLEVEAQKAALDSNVTLGSAATYNFVVYSEIPYSTNLDNVSFVLTEKSSANSADKTIYNFSGQKVTEISSIKKNEIYSNKISGKKSDAKLLKSMIYEGESDDYFYAEFEVANKELRASSISEMTGYLVDNSGEVIPVSFSTFDQKVAANGNVLLSASAKIDKGIDPSDYEFVFGQSVASAADSAENKGNILVKPVKYSLSSNDVTTVNSTLNKIQLPGYTLNLNRVNAMLNVTGMYTVTGLKLTFDYDLVRDTAYDYIAGNHKLMFEFVDQGTGKTTYSKEFTLGNPANGEIELEEANDQAFEIQFEDQAIQSKVQSYDKYKLNIYDVYEDAKILVASKELKWFTVE
ncbi:hypothetical protein [Paenibacillus sp. HB172176]|uniref:hypothetical protein n=1 Tax=Paenibacillus sp. HB172176 TaxID=2493690 RepID=UPI001439FAF5|nr:hypothetical protein [Paenibacillus sp. HB172176]